MAVAILADHFPPTFFGPQPRRFVPLGRPKPLQRHQPNRQRAERSARGSFQDQILTRTAHWGSVSHRPRR